MPMMHVLQPQQRQAFVHGQSMSLLRLTTAELTEHLLEQAQANPLLLVRPPRRRMFIANAAEGLVEAMAAPEICGLHAHVAAELSDLTGRGGLLARAIEALTEHLEPSGWLGGDLPDIAVECGIAGDLLEAVLKLVQKRVEPAGLFARNLGECLRIQIVAQESMSPAMEAVLNHLDCLLKGNIAQLAARAGISAEEAAACLARIRKLDPKPGTRFSTDPPLMREPDARVVRGAHGWEAVFERSAEPSVSVLPLPHGARRESSRRGVETGTRAETGHGFAALRDQAGGDRTCGAAAGLFRSGGSGAFPACHG